MLHITRQCMDCPVLIFDMDRKLIAETVVTGYGKEEMYIEVMEGLANVAIGTRFRLLVMQPESVSEFTGKLNSKRQGIYEISIYGQKRRDSRGSPRFTFNIPAIIGTFVVDAKPVKLRQPINVTILNLSSTGLMLESVELPLQTGVSLNVEFKLHGRDSTILCKVVREPTQGSTPNSFGCQLVFLKDDKAQKEAVTN